MAGTAGRAAASKRKQAASRSGRRWSQRVTQRSDALTLDKGVFTLRDPKRIAASLKRSAMRSRRRKADPFRSALSMLTLYVNRAGRGLAGCAQENADAGKGRAAQAIRKRLSFAVGWHESPLK